MRPVLHPVLADQPGHLLWRAHARVQAAVDAVLPPDVDLHGHAVLVALADGACRSQQELADALGLSRTTLARTAQSLDDAGLVARSRHPHDGRSYVLARTRAGSTAVRRWRRLTDDLQLRLGSGLTASEHDELLELLGRVADDVVPDAPAEVRESLGFLVSRLHGQLYRDFLAALAPLGLEPRLFGALKVLADTGPVSQAELARYLGTSGPSLVQIADALEARGLVARRVDPADRRSRLLHLEPRAAVVQARAQAIAADVVAARFGGLGVRRTARLVRLLRTFVTAPVEV